MSEGLWIAIAAVAALVVVVVVVLVVGLAEPEAPTAEPVVPADAPTRRVGVRAA